MPSLYMFLLGGRPAGRKTEQHDVFFAIGNSVAELAPEISKSWPELKGNLHVDAWRAVRLVEGYSVIVSEHSQATSAMKLFFINLGGYKPGEFEEFHYKLIIPALNKGEAVAKAKQTAFYKHTGFPGAPSHIDDRYGIDVDDIYEIKEILSDSCKQRYSVQLEQANKLSTPDPIHLGYFKLASIQAWGVEP